MRNKRSVVKGERGRGKAKNEMGETYVEADQEKREGLEGGD
jgi:hypothetical protein